MVDIKKMNEHYTSDEAIIKQYSLLYDCYGDSFALFKAIDSIKITYQDSDKQVIWKSIFSGIKYQVMENYAESVTEFEKVEKLIKKNTLLDLFFQRQKLFSYVFATKQNVENVIALYNQLLAQYKDNLDSLIEPQIIAVMIDESYVVWKLGGKSWLLKIEDKIIEKYENSPNDDILFCVAKAMNNKANDLDKQGLQAEAILLLDKIEEKYRNHDEPRITKQVIRAINRKALLFYENDDLGEALQQYKKITDNYSKKRNCIYIFEDLLVKALIAQAVTLSKMNKKNDALVLYNTAYKSYKDSDNLNVHEYILWTVSLKMELLKEIGKFDEQIKIADKVVKKFMKSNNISTLLKLLDVMFEKARTLYYQGKWYKEIDVYNNIIKMFNNANPPPCIKIWIIRAMQYKASSLEQMGVFDKAIQTYDEAIKFCVESQDRDNFKIIYLLVNKAELLADAGDYDGYEKIYKDICRENINSDDTEIREIIAKLMFNRTFFEGRRGNFPEKIQLYKEIIRLFGDDTAIDVVEVVTNAIFKLGKMLHKDKKLDEAIQVYSSIMKYADCNNNTIQSRIAVVLNNRIICLRITGNKNEEIKAYEEFIEMFKSSGDDEIKEMISIAELELTEKRQNLEDGANL